LIFAFEQAELQMASHKSVSVVVAANWSEFAQRSALRARQQMAEDRAAASAATSTGRMLAFERRVMFGRDGNRCRLSASQ
jgi:hypothetical protein